MDHSAYVDAAAATLGLKIAAEHRPGVLQFFALAASMAELVQGLPLEPHDESGNVFHAGAAARRRRRMNVDDAAAIAAQVRDGALSARAAVEHSLARIEATDARINAFSARLAERALKRAELIDVHPQRHKMPLAGVPFAVKNLFDVAGLPTLAGSKIERDAAPARRDAVLVRRLEAHGAVLVGALHMDEYAYGFSTENTPLRADAQPARPDAHQRRLQRRLGRGGGGRPGAAEPGLRHQRLDPRARRRCAACSA